MKITAISLIILLGVGYVAFGSTETARENFASPFTAVNATDKCPTGEGFFYVLSSVGSATISSLWACVPISSFT